MLLPSRLRIRTPQRLADHRKLIGCCRIQPYVFGVEPHAAAQLVLSWSHQGRITSEAAFARLAGAAPIPASSGQTIRYRLDRSGDRKLNRALHMILVTRKRSHPATTSYIQQKAKTRREANRCPKRYLARSLYRLVENTPTWTFIEASLAQHANLSPESTPRQAEVMGARVGS
jgi:transposase